MVVSVSLKGKEPAYVEGEKQFVESFSCTRPLDESACRHLRGGHEVGGWSVKCEHLPYVLILIVLVILILILIIDYTVIEKSSHVTDPQLTVSARHAWCIATSQHRNVYQVLSRKCW